tara:strand:- start:144 stop:779 length:636 start_codon:yes stop_codon:yes gene_type:complete
MGDIATAFSQEELGMTVEQYLQGQCQQRVAGLKRHMNERLADFESSVKRGRQALKEIANPPAEDAEVELAPELAAAVAAKGPLCDPFALVAIAGPKAGEIFKIEATEEQTVWKIGREKTADISLFGDDEVSSKHAQVAYQKKQFKLMDMGSTNGTLVTTGTAKGKPIKLQPKKNHILKVNHLVRVGGSDFRWCYHSDVPTVLEQVEALKNM